MVEEDAAVVSLVARLVLEAAALEEGQAHEEAT